MKFENVYWSGEYRSPVGQLTLACDGERLTGLWIEGQKYFGATASGTMEPGVDLPILARTREWLDRYFAGERPAMEELPLAPAGTPFRQAVWRLLGEIPYGQAATYGALASIDKNSVCVYCEAKQGKSYLRISQDYTYKSKTLKPVKKSLQVSRG